MTHKYPLIAAGVAAALGSGYVQAAAPTIAQAAAATNTMVIAGSSAAKDGIINGIENDICGSSANTLLVTSSGGTKNFFALSCNVAQAIGTNISNGELVTIYYRNEGGSVVGALPIASSHTILRMNLADASCTGSGLTATCTINGTTSTNGPNDSWTGAVIADNVDLGVTDVEPGVLTGANYPTPYSAAAFGSASTAQMKALNHTRLYQQVFGLAVNNSGGSLPATINLTRESAANILLHNYTNWNKVPDALTGNPIASASVPITLVNREAGSGTRAGANLYFLLYQCGSTSALSPATGNFSTADELVAVNGTAGAIGYTVVDQLLKPSNATSWTNLVLATINGVTPSNLAAATGQYDYWYEATTILNPGTAGATLDLANFVQTDLPKISDAPNSPAINAIPGIQGNVGTVPLSDNGAAGTSKVYINPFTRSGTSCNVPAEQN